jgi:thioredoxin-dependent peroxiredoxin
MIDPPKATKGRRMSKKTRKKSPKAPARKATRATSRNKSTSSAKTTSAKTSKAAAKKPAGGTGKQPGLALPKASHSAPSKPLKTSGRSESVARAKPASKAPAAKPATVKPSADKVSGTKTGAVAPGRLGLSEGAKAPAFRLPRDGGDSVALADFKGRKLVLFFYPRADTPGCTKEAIDFSRLSGAFAEHRTAVLGVSADPPKAQEAFRDKHELATPLASDEQHEMLDAYGVWGEKSMYGKTFHGILRTTVLVGEDGRIVRIWRHVRVDGHADEVLAAVRAL